MAEATMLSVTNLEKRFVLHERGRVLQAFASVTFTAVAGRLTALVGSSGSGKSSILKCIYRTYLPTSGEILYRCRGGEMVDLSSISEPEILHLRRQEIGFVSQFLSVLPRQPTVDVVARPLLINGMEAAQARKTASDMLAQVGLPSSLWDVPPHTFSGGERQLVNLSRALVVHPRLMLLDEPTASLDPASTEQVIRVIEKLKNSQMAIVAVFHDRQIVKRLADDCVQLQGGLEWSERLGDVAENGTVST